MQWRRCLGSVFVFLASFSSIYGTPHQLYKQISMRAQESCSDVVLIGQHGKILHTYGNTSQYLPIETRSVTKSFVSLAIGLLLQEGKICSLETPVYYYFPEWNQGCKKFVTIQHLLNHTSGLQQGENIYQYPDIVRLALASDIITTPGERFIYNNNAANLLAAIVQKASGMSLHEFLRIRLFDPLCVKSDSWMCDKARNDYGMAHLSINAVDLAKIGVLLLNNGTWNNARLLSPEWINQLEVASQYQNPFSSYLWWIGYSSLNVFWDPNIIQIYANAGVSPCYIEALNSLEGRVLNLDGYISYGNFAQKCADQIAPLFGGIFGGRHHVIEFFHELEKKGLPLACFDAGEVKSLAARGYGGQLLIIFPEEDLFAVRLAQNCGFNCGQRDTFVDLELLLNELVDELAARDVAKDCAQCPCQ